MPQSGHARLSRLLVTLFGATCGGAETGFRVLVMSESSYSELRDAEKTKEALMGQGVTEVRFLHAEAAATGWNYLAWIAELEPKWTLTVPAGAEVNASAVRRLVATQDADFYGYAITDPPDGLISHDFDTTGLLYPLPNTGFLISPRIGAHIVDRLRSSNSTHFVFDPDFSFAKFLALAPRVYPTDAVPLGAWPQFPGRCSPPRDLSEDSEARVSPSTPIAVHSMHECQQVCETVDDCSAIEWWHPDPDPEDAHCRLVLGGAVFPEDDGQFSTQFHPPATRGDGTDNVVCAVRALYMCHMYEWEVYPRTAAECMEDAQSYVYFEHGGCGVDNGCSCCLRLEYSPFLFSGTCTLHTARSIAPPLIVPFPVSLHACFVKCGRVPFCPAIAYDDLTHQCLLYVGFPMASVFVGVVQKTFSVSRFRCYHGLVPFAWPRYESMCVERAADGNGDVGNIWAQNGLFTVFHIADGDYNSAECSDLCLLGRPLCVAFEWYESGRDGGHRCFIIINTDGITARPDGDARQSLLYVYAEHGPRGRTPITWERRGGTDAQCFVRPLKTGYHIKHIPHWRTEVVKKVKHRSTIMPAREGQLLVAVKTTQKYHQSRVMEVLQQTWATDPRLEVLYMTDSDDLFVPNVINVHANAPKGYCAKMHAMLTYLADRDAHADSARFILISDDDTLYNVTALLALLQDAYDPQRPLYAGEKYFTGTYDMRQGLVYITTGGGLLLTTATLAHFKECGEECKCDAPDDPDDWHVGEWLLRRGILPTHHPGFHQRRPVDYPIEVIVGDSAPVHVSFHNIFGVALSPGWEERGVVPGTKEDWKDIWRFLNGTTVE